MTNEQRPELGDAQLLAYLDGEADSEVVEHMEQCAQCRERAKQMALLQGRLTSRLYRLACPSSIDLGEYHLGLLGQEQTGAVALHLAECPHCSREVAQLQAYLADLEPDVTLGTLEQVKIVIAELVRGVQGLGQLPTLAPAPAYAGLRGEEAGPLVYQGDAFQIVFEVQRDAEHRERHALLGLVTGPDLEDLDALLWRAGNLVATVPVDQLGNLYIPNLSPGHYELILRGAQVEIQIPSLPVGDP